MPSLQLINAFNAGEVSDLLDSRTDLDKYPKACKVLENFFLFPYGGAIRRSGTEYLGQIGNMDRRARVIGFNYSTITSFILELGEEYIRFWSNGQQVIDPDTSEIVQVSTPYHESDLRTLQYSQINDLVYFVHPDYPVYKLSRLSDTDWTMEEAQWDWPAFLDENVEELTITPSATTGSITLTASDDLWNENHVGAFWEIAHRREDASVQRALAGSDGFTDGIDVLGDWSFTTYGNWIGTVALQRSFDGTNYETIRNYTNTAAGDRNIAATGKESKQCKLRIKWSSGGSGNTNPRALLEVGDNRVYGYVKITAFTDAQTVSANVIADLYDNTETKNWAEGAWSKYQGYPRTVAIHEQRLCFGGTKLKPLTIWGSIIDDFQNFRYSSNDDAAFSFALAAGEANPINWMVSQQALLIGTAADEWTIGGSDASQTLSPTNVQAKRQSSYGSQYLQSRIINDVVLFTQRQARKVRELVFAFEKDGWVAPDLTILSEHITKGGIVETAFQQQPHAIFWCIRNDGQLLGMTYERDQNVVGWHRHITTGEFESVATIYGGSGPDEVWVIVKRTINGNTVRYMERFKTDAIEQWENKNKLGWWYLDCAILKTVANTTTITGLEHLEGKTVGILADGAVQPDVVVEDGSIELQYAASNVVVGLPYISTLRPMDLSMMLQDGTSLSRKTRVPRIAAKILNSLNGQFSTDGEKWQPIYFRNIDDKMDDSPETFTGYKEVYTLGNYTENASVWIRQISPLPLCITALVPRWEAYGD